MVIIKKKEKGKKGVGVVVFKEFIAGIKKFISTNRDLKHLPSNFSQTRKQKIGKFKTPFSLFVSVFLLKYK